MLCRACGAPADSAFCGSCGARIESADVGTQHVPEQREPRHDRMQADLTQVRPTSPRAALPPAQPPGPPRSSHGSAVVAGVLVGVLLVVLGVGGAVLLLDGDHGRAADAAPAARRTPRSSPSPNTGSDRSPASAPTPPASSDTHSRAEGPGPVDALPSGLFCRDLRGDGYSYVAAVDYWRLHGEPNQMDEDRNGVPCETVYPPSDVSAYWSKRGAPDPAPRTREELPPGLSCRNLFDRGVSYADAVAYWGSAGYPARMDIDHDGQPCGSVYPASDLASYWG